MSALGALVPSLKRKGMLGLLRHRIPYFGGSQMADTLVRQLCLLCQSPFRISARTIELSLIELHGFQVRQIGLNWREKSSELQQCIVLEQVGRIYIT